MCWRLTWDIGERAMGGNVARQATFGVCFPRSHLTFRVRCALCRRAQEGGVTVGGAGSQCRLRHGSWINTTFNCKTIRAGVKSCTKCSRPCCMGCNVGGATAAATRRWRRARCSSSRCGFDSVIDRPWQAYPRDPSVRSVRTSGTQPACCLESSTGQDDVFRLQ